MPSRQPPSPSSSPSSLQTLPPHLIPLISVAGAGIFSLIIIIVVVYRKLNLSRRTAPLDEERETHRKIQNPPELRRFSFSLLRKSTGAFSVSHRLGQGGFGSVYRATLSSTGENVAVKVMETSGTIQGEREFHNEISLANRVISTVGSQFLVSVVGYSCSGGGIRCGGGGGGGERKLIVYELMVNGSLQEKLLDCKCVELSVWKKRYKVILDVARALYYLHYDCGPTPVVHGDVKPSNVLLDENFNAKLGDFGLATILDENEKVKDEEARVLVEIDDDDCECNDNDNDDDVVKVKIEGENGSIVEEEVESESVVTTVERSPTAGSNMMASPSDGFERASSLPESWVDKMSVESGKIGKKKNGGGSGRDYWWWKQDNGGNGGVGGGVVGSESGRVKDYVMEWIGSEIKKERPKSSDLIGGSGSGLTCNDGGDVKVEGKKQKKKRMDWWRVSMDEDKFRKKREKNRRPREWWKEEFCEELTKKSKGDKKKKKTGVKSSGGSELWWQRDEDFVAPERKKRRKSRGSLGSIDWWLDGLSGELRGGRRNSQDWASGDVPKSGGISSTPSMRGTVCYIAPEYGGGGQVSEKCDVYSFGVLVLVIISGRRPLQVMASPMSVFERANLVSWARQLAYNGKLLDLVDSLIESLDKDQAMLCITIALLCLQRSPCKRPNMKEIVEMLTGEAEPPHLPFEFSPSPPSNFPFKSRKKARNGEGSVRW
ncbi:receptor-like serine/threonine-protein kinase At2g45590 isoform X2 [Beta vulgaris subsp. vulgaris]|uniref:receptor-like serine/threonine-protein kinase At2g45590 isoform X2 n=2 Tax=Beta vulgaris subsp. vulgaris TaxID=3555 RepID=UPI0020367D3E|nr:receptor-like serine/threonine-protein kinase At2g45590 isoform X2 [Beta vulgaris subsp. vulgaris]